MASSEDENTPGYRKDVDQDGTDDTVPPPPPDGRDAPSAGQQRQMKREQIVNRLIEDASVNGAIMLDLSHKGLQEIPEPMLEMKQLQYLYLEGNELNGLPDNFFDCLPELKWLDLRRNYLVSVPSTYIGSHKNLRTILLENNNLRTLPLELGLIPTLTGLNIAHNPLEFPPSEIVEKGAKHILMFFREMLQSKMQGKLPTDALKMEELRLYDKTDSESSASSAEWESQEGELLNSYSYKQSMLQRRNSRDSQQSFLDSDSDLPADLVGPVPHSAALHKPKSYTEHKHLQLQRLQRAGALGQIDKRSRKQRKIVKYQDPMPLDVVEEKMQLERRLNKIKAIKEKQDLILQRRKDNEMLKGWRDETKKRQQRKFMARLNIKEKDYTDPVLRAPFDIDQQHLKIPTNEERIAQEVRATHEKLRHTISPRSKLQLEQARAERDQELERKVKLHMVQMQERRKKPKGTPQEEMIAAKKDLEIAEKLHRELASRRKELEYRFQAFTGGDM